MAKRVQDFDRTRGIGDVPEVAPPERIVSSASLLARMLGVHRQTVAEYVKRNMPTHKTKPRKNGGYDYEFDIAAVWEWQFQQGVVFAREQAAKESSRAPAPAAVPPGGWVHPTTGKVITDEEVILAEKRKIIADANFAEHREGREFVKRRSEEGSVVDVSDGQAALAYFVALLSVGLLSIMAPVRKELEDLGMHPNDARAKTETPLLEMLTLMRSARLDYDPTREDLVDELDDEDAHVDDAGPGPDEAGGVEPDAAPVVGDEYDDTVDLDAAAGDSG